MSRTQSNSPDQEGKTLSANESPTQFLETLGILRTRLDRLQESLPEFTDDYHRLFVYFVGQQFEEVPPDALKICDRQNDQKVDFYKMEEDRFIVYQCKLPELDRVEREDKIAAFGADLVNEAEDILTFMTDSAGTAKGNPEAQEARNRYRSAKSSEGIEPNYQLEVVVAFFGKLTRPAEERLDELRKKWSNDNQQFKISVRDYNDIATELNLSLIAGERPKEIKLNFKASTVVHTDEWGYGLVPAFTFYELFNKHHMALFDLNVRYFLEQSSVNKDILDTLSTVPGQKRFHLLNNGVTVACENWRKSNVRTKSNESQPWMTLYKAQIINGCQTVISIYRAYTQMDEEYKQRHLKENCFVPVRIVKTSNRGLLDEVVTASNNQNKMSSRNLRSNTRVQRVLQQKFDQLKPRWFYERKDGEFESLKRYPGRTFKPKEYESEGRYRIVSNEAIAKAWLSFTGFSTFASEQINAFESVGDPITAGRYELLFNKRPTTQHWSAITLGPQVEFNEDNFEPSSPAPEQYLLSYLVLEFVKAYLPSPQANKKECEEHLRKSKKITEYSSAEDKNKAMMEDERYLLNQILSNMKEVIVELFTWIFAQTYGPINEITARQLLRLPGLSDIYENPDIKSYVKILKETDPKVKINNILFICMEFIKEGVLRWMSVYKREYLASQRRIRYLHSPQVIEQVKGYLVHANESTRGFAEEWKPPDVTFLKSLPKLAKS